MKYVGKSSDALAKQFWIFDLLELQFIKNALNVPQINLQNIRNAPQVMLPVLLYWPTTIEKLKFPANIPLNFMAA